MAEGVKGKKKRKPKKKAPRKPKPAPVPTLRLPELPGVKELAEQLNVSKADAYRLARRKGAPLFLGGGRGRGYRFVSLKAVRAWLDTDRALRLPSPAGCADSVARFAREGWAGDACLVCKRDPGHPTYAFARIGDHVRAFRRRGRVVVVCWCSARTGSTREALLPDGDLELIPGPAGGGERRHM